MAPCSRREFFALAGAGCVLVGCSQGATPSGTVTALMNRATLAFADFPELAMPGGSVVVEVAGRFPIVVVRTADAAATALSATCTHAGCLVAYSPAANQVHCPCHGAGFSLDGSVARGPAAIPLPVYTATVGLDAIVIDLS